MVAPTFVDVLKAWQLDTLGRLRVAMPATVLSYSPPPVCRVNVLLALQGRDAVGTRQIPIPVYSVPVIFPRGGGMLLRWDLLPGDELLLLVADRAMDRWLEAGGTVDLESDRAHELADAIALPGLSSTPHPWPVVTPGQLVLGREDGTAVLTIATSGATARLDAPLVQLGSIAGAIHPAAHGDTLVTIMTALATGLQGSLDPATALAGTALQTALGLTPPVSTKVVVE